ncbi:signal transducer and transcription activator-like [Drosophila willistoni]|uniref:signal transducer and transcription activator-like n=1 Tax=Drosophila willistoni TaxID=7260 RepID=UPI000C26CDBD|nr:signal transducer and transcription activator-like [Drosophila willistoni]
MKQYNFNSNAKFEVIFQCPYLDENQDEEYQVNCILVSGNQFQEIQENWHLESPIPYSSSGILENSCGILKNQNGQHSAIFSQLRLTRGKQTKFALDEKFALFFYATIRIDNQPIRIWKISNPIVVIFHANQECLAQSTIWWDTEFPDTPREFFSVKDVVKCDAVAEKLANYADEYTRNFLDNNNIDFIREKLKITAGGDYISFKKFSRELLPGCVFTFWEWFYNILKLLEPPHKNHDEIYYITLDDSVPGLWERGLITGFVSKENSQKMLQEQPIGTLLIRFSESQKGSLHFVYKNTYNSIQMFAPWDQWHLKRMNMAATLGQLEKAQYLYSPHMGLQKLHHVLYSFRDISKMKTKICNTSFGTWRTLFFLV